MIDWTLFLHVTDRLDVVSYATLHEYWTRHLAQALSCGRQKTPIGTQTSKTYRLPTPRDLRPTLRIMQLQLRLSKNKTSRASSLSLSAGFANLR